MSLALLDLPEDIVLAILLNLPAKDILSVGQSCRGLHAITSGEWLWHQIKIDLPLDVDISGSGICDSSAAELRQSFIRALRLERNWGRCDSTLEGITRIPHSGSILFNQFISRRWFATLSSSPGGTFWSLWDLDPTVPSRVALIDAPNQATSFHCALSKDGFSATVFLVSVKPTLSSARLVLGYQIALTESTSWDNVHLIFSSTRPHEEGVAYNVRLSGNAAVVQFITTPTAGYSWRRALLIDISTGIYTVLDPTPDDMGTGAGVRLLVDGTFLFASNGREQEVVVKVYDLRDYGLFTRDASSSDVQKLQSPIQVMSAIHGLSSTNSNASSHISRNRLVMLYSHNLSYFVSSMPAGGWRVHGSFHLDGPHVFVDKIVMGATGTRVVWIETDHEKETTTLRRATFPTSSDPTPREACNLLPESQVLPFDLNRMHTCVSLDLEEASGRIAVSLHTGDVYIIDL